MREQLSTQLVCILAPLGRRGLPKHTFPLSCIWVSLDKGAYVQSVCACLDSALALAPVLMLACYGLLRPWLTRARVAMSNMDNNTLPLIAEVDCCTACCWTVTSILVPCMLCLCCGCVTEYEYECEVCEYVSHV